MPFSCRQRWVRFVLVSLLLVLALTGCGGGGGGGPAATGPPPLWGLGSINADVAYDNIESLKGQAAEPGAGVTIGFIDSGIDQDHPAFAGKTVTEQHLEGTPDETGTSRFSHGTAVASVAAGRYGVAWGADIAMFAITLGRGGGNYVPISLGGLAGRNDDWAKRVSDALAWRDGSRAVDILNVSIAVNGIIDSYSEQQLRANFGDAIAAMAQTGATEKTIFVWGAGNAHNDPCEPADLSQCVNGKVNAVSVEVLAGLAARIAELRGHTLAVVALRPASGSAPEGIASFSNRCGIAAEFCIAAPGQAVGIAYFGPDSGSVVRDFRSGKGTSFSAPMVAGGLALLKQLFRDQLANTELVARMLETADNSGRYANRAIYGRGKMDLGAATSPVGMLSVPIARRAGGTTALLQSTRFQPGPAFGDGPSQSLASREMMALDDLDAPFWFGLGGFAPAADGPSVSARLRDFLASVSAWQSPMTGFRLAAGRSGLRRGAAPAWLRVGFLETPAHTGGGHLALAQGAFTTAVAGHGGLAAAAYTTRGTPARTPAMGATLMWRPEDSPLGVQAGWMGEPQALLGSVGHGAFGTLAGDTGFVGVEGNATLGNWRLGVNAEFGAVHPETRGGVIAGVSPLSTSAFALHAGTAPADWGAVRFSVSQPLRVERGRARLIVPAARTKAGAVLHRSVRVDLAPSGRQIDVAGQWSRALARGELRLGGVWSYRPGHGKAADPEVTLLAGWRWGF